MSPRDQEKGVLVDARNLWLESRNAEAVLKKLPKSCNIERRLMQGILKVGDRGNLHAAFDSLPR